MLPPLGQLRDDNHGDYITFMACLATEGRDVRTRMLEQQEECLTTYDLGVETDDPYEPALINDSQNGVITATDIQTRTPPEPTVVPVEEGEGGPAFWVGPETALPPEFTAWHMGEGGDPVPPQSLPQALVEQLRAAGQDRYIVTVDDAQVAKFCTTIFKLVWNRSGMERWLRRNLLNNNAKGWQFVWFLHDRFRRMHILRNVPNCQVMCDLMEDVSEMAWVMVDDVLPKDMAMKLFPELDAAIEELALPGGGVIPFANGGWSRFTARYYWRPVVPIRMLWMRDQAIPMTPQEALDAGAIQPAQQTVVVGQDDNGMPTMGQQPVPGQYVLADGTPVAEGDEHWPARYGIREIIQIGQKIVADRECRDWDIPVALNVNIPVLGTPYGYGEPYRMRGLQRSKNRLLQAIVDYSDYYRFPVTVMSNSMKASLGEFSMVEPGTVIGCPDNVLAAAGGKINIFMDLPQLPPASAQFLPAITNELDKQSQNAPVLQGYAPGANMSGQAIENLQYSASATVSYRAKTSSDMAYRLARLQLHALMMTLTPQEANRMVSRLPIHIEAAILDRYHRGQYDVEVEVQAGNGAAAQKTRDQVNEDQKSGRISTQTAREKLNIDHFKESDRMEDEMREKAKLQAEMAPPPPPRPMVAGSVPAGGGPMRGPMPMPAR